MTKRTTHFATKKAINSKTPTWAKNMVGIVFVLTSCAALFIAGTSLVNEDVKVELLLAIKAIDGVAAGIAKLCGVTYEEIK